MCANLSKLWKHYKKTVFLSPLPPSDSFAIITAHNPQGQTLSKLENEKRHWALRGKLGRCDILCWEVTGGSQDFSYQEKGWGALIPRQEAIQMGLHFQQNAIYWVQSGILHLLPCVPEMPEEQLGYFMKARYESDLETRIQSEKHSLKNTASE